MKAIGITETGGPEKLQFIDAPDPEPGMQDIVVRVRAIGVNPVDAIVRSGAFGKTVDNPPRIIGWDAAGVIESVGAGVERWAPGAEVMFAGNLERRGCYAELVAVDERIVGRKPSNLTFEQAAAMPLTSLTAWEAFLENMRAPLGVPAMPMTALIVGGGGGVGSIAIQIAKMVCGLTVVATASREESTLWCRELGADQVINHSEPFAPQIEQAGLRGMDFILNTAEPWPMDEMTSVLNPLGKICCITGKSAANVNMSALFPLRGTLTLESMFARSMKEAEPEKQGLILDQVAGLLEAETVVPTLKRTMSWKDVQAAHEAIATGHTLGKIVMTVD